MNLDTIIEGLKRSLGRYPNVYAEARLRQTALVPFTTASHAVRELGSEGGLDEAQRGELILTLMTEQALRAHPLWQGMLACAFAPMLAKLRRRLGQRPDEDLDQEVLASFFEALRALPRIPAPDVAVIALWRATARPVFARVRLDREDAAVTREGHPFDDDDSETLPAGVWTPAEQGALAEASADEAARVVQTGGGGDELLEVVLATYSGEESLKAFVHRVLGGDPEQERATYERLRSARRRLRDRLRKSAAYADFLC